MSWTSSIKKVQLGPLTEVTVNFPSDEDSLDFFSIGSISLDSDVESLFAAAGAEAAAYRNLLTVHDCYMSAECEAYGDYVQPEDISGKSLTYYLSSVMIDLDNSVGVTQRVILPLLFSPEITVTEDRKKSKQKTIHQRGCRGLCYRGGIACTISPDTGETTRTLRHEFIHGLKMCIPHLMAEMYGDNPEAVTEEVVAHIVADHFDKLTNLGQLKFEGVMQDIAVSSNKYVTNTLSCFRATSVTIGGVPVQFKRRVTLKNCDMNSDLRECAAVDYYQKARAALCKANLLSQNVKEDK